MRTAPSHDWPICQDRSKCTVICLNLLDTFEPILDSRAVTVCIAPSHNPVTSTAKNNAKARSVAAIFPSMAIAVRWSPSLSHAVRRDFLGSTTLWSAATSLKKPSWNEFCARTLKSPTLEDSGIENVSLRPLGKATVTWNIRHKILNVPGSRIDFEPNCTKYGTKYQKSWSWFNSIGFLGGWS
jgi:hypothetical protein